MKQPSDLQPETVPPDERRGSGRAPTLRRAILSLLSGQGSIVQGTAVDLSADGLRVHTPLPQAVGQEVEVRLPSRAERPGEAEVCLAGRVVWSMPVAGAPHAAGIRLHAAQVPVEDVGGRAEAEALLTRVREQLRARAEEGGAALVEITRHAGAYDPETRGKTSPWRWAVLAVLLLLLFLGSFVLLRRLPLAAFSTDADAKVEAQDAPALDAAQAAFLAGDTSFAMFEFERLAKRGKTPAIRLIAALGQADALRRFGRAPEAAAVVQRALETSEGAPKAWRDLASGYRARVLVEGGGAQTPPLLVQALDLLRPGDPQASVSPVAAPAPTEADAPGAEVPRPTPTPSQRPGDAAPDTAEAGPGAGEVLRLSVDKSDYVLTVFRGDRAVAEYPVGLGMNDTTPLGDFVIANKIANPDWYHRGESVKAGDPRNPLGAEWMGLGDARGPTSYGIHPTQERSSIGGNRSRGCVRMRPEDAAALFRVCAVGTPVQIVE